MKLNVITDNVSRRPYLSRVQFGMPFSKLPENRNQDRNEGFKHSNYKVGMHGRRVYI